MVIKVGQARRKRRAPAVDVGLFLADGAVRIPAPTVVDALERPDQTAAALAVLEPGGESTTTLLDLLPTRLSDAGLIDALIASERQVAVIQARQQQLLAEIARRDPDGEAYLRDEAACALKLAPGTASGRLDIASALTGRLWDTFRMLETGRISYLHARILATAVDPLSDEVTAAVQTQVLRRARSQTPGEFRAAVTRAIAKFDTRDQKKRHQDAFADRRVVHYPEDDGMASIWLRLAADGAATFMAAVNARACATKEAGDDRTADQRRADAAVEIALAALDNPHLPTQHGTRPTINVTIADTTLHGDDDQPADLHGYGSITADMARRIAHQPGATLHRWTVDSNGRIIDDQDSGGTTAASDRTVGRSRRKTRAGTTTRTNRMPGRSHRKTRSGATTTRTGRTRAGSNKASIDQYQPTVAIARHVITRDQHCVHPGCRHKAIACELDHRIAWPHGATSIQNLQPLCKRHHDLKHHSRWQVNKNSNGDYDWTSPTGHHYRYRPPELPIPTRQSAPEADDEPPPF